MSSKLADMSSGVQRGVQPDAPNPAESQSGANGPDVADCLREALDHLAQRPQRSPDTGKFVAGGLAAGKTLERSAIFWTAVEPIKRDLVARVSADLAHDADTPETALGLADGYVEVRLFRQAMFLRLAELGGPVTTKGKKRALFTAYLGALDRETKLALALGLERRQKGVTDLAAAFAATDDKGPA